MARSRFLNRVSIASTPTPTAAAPLSASTTASWKSPAVEPLRLCSPAKLRGSVVTMPSRRVPFQCPSATASTSGARTATSAFPPPVPPSMSAVLLPAIFIEIGITGSSTADILGGTGGGNALVAVLAPLVEAVALGHWNGTRLDGIVTTEPRSLAGLQSLRGSTAGDFQLAVVDADNGAAAVGVGVDAILTRFKNRERAIGSVYFDGVARG